MNTRFYAVTFNKDFKLGNPRTYSGSDTLPTLYDTVEKAQARVTEVNGVRADYEARVVILDVVGEPLMHGGKMVGVVPL